jgi:membrane fusion protein (multidrug efflux system)
MADTPKTSSHSQIDAPKFNGSGKTGDAETPSATKYAAKDDADPQDQNPGSGKNRPNPRRQLIIGLIVAVAVIFGIIWGVNFYHYSKTHVSTDDAYVTGNLVNVSPIISGTLSQLTVEEGDTVKAGQLIGRLEDSGPRAALRQAQAAYAAAESQIPQARISLVYQQEATKAAINHAQAEINGQSARTLGAQQQVTLSAATVRNQVAQAQSQVAQAEAQAAGVRAQVSTAEAGVQAQEQAVETAQRAADAAGANIAAAQANRDKAARDETRYATLVKQEAVTQQQYDAAAAAAISADSEWQAVKQQAAQAQSQVATARANVRQAQAQLRTAQKQADAADQQVDVARAGLNLARANFSQIGIQQSNVANNVEQGGQAQADLANAKAGSEQIALRQQEIATYQAQAAQAKASLENAQVLLNDNAIYAPTDGQVVRKTVNVGAALSPGQTIVTLTAGQEVWVTANFKETQLTHVRPGQPAEVEVDTFPGKIFKGEVQAIEDATGASTALLPPDNATGNFTKVVQRVSVRIKLIPAADEEDKKYARAADIRSLRQGFSTSVTIDTSSAQ